jgi:hypothetical protein
MRFAGMLAGGLALTSLMVAGSLVPSTPARGEEINFQEFVQLYLQKNKVEKLVVLNNSVATVYLKDTVLALSLAFRRHRLCLATHSTFVYRFPMRAARHFDLLLLHWKCRLI